MDSKNDEIAALGEGSCSTANESNMSDKVSRKIHINSNNVRDSAILCIVPTSPVIEDKYELQLSF